MGWHVWLSMTLISQGLLRLGKVNSSAGVEMDAFVVG